MRRATIASLCLSLIVSGFGVPAASAAPPSYTIVDLGAPTGYSIAYGLNELPVAVGNAETPTLTVEAARWEAGVRTTLPSLNGAGGTLARAVNEAGLAVGESYDGSGGVHAVSWSTGAVTDLGTLFGNYSTAFAVNDAGQIVGEGHTAPAFQVHALLWDGGAPVDLEVLPGGDASHARGINNAGQITGDSEIEPGGRHHAVIWESGGIADLGTLPGDDDSIAVAINASGHVTGRSLGRSGGGQFGFFWDGATMVELPMLPGGTFLEAAAMNDLDQVVGRGDRYGAYQSAFLWEASTGVTVDLQTLLPSGSGWQLQHAFAINNAGQIAGYGTHDGALRAFLMTPGTDPAPTDTVVADLPIGGTVSTDSGPAGATSTDPIATTLQTPVAGVVTIREGVGFPGVPGFTLLGQPITITAPLSDPANPYRITFVFDASLIPAGSDETSVQIYRDSDPALPCLGTLVADPDPCVVDRQLLAGGDVQITVLTSHASFWGGFVSNAPPPFPFTGFFSPVANPPSINAVKAGATVPLRFSLGGNRGLDILAPGSPTSHAVSCDVLRLGGGTTRVQPQRGGSRSGLTYKAKTQIYTFSWKTDRSWRGCRAFVLTLSDGSQHTAWFRFRR